MNMLPKAKRKFWLFEWLSQFKSPLMLILLFMVCFMYACLVCKSLFQDVGLVIL
jgi:hypothetical protein